MVSARQRRAVAGPILQVVATARPDAEVISETLSKKRLPHACLLPAPKEGVFRVLVGPLKDAANTGRKRAPNLEAAGFKLHRTKDTDCPNRPQQLVQLGRAARRPVRGCPNGCAKAPPTSNRCTRSRAETAPPESAHGLRIGALPQHPRMFQPRRGDVHDSRQSVHARLRLLFGAQRVAAKHEFTLDPDEPANVARMAAQPETCATS